MIRLITISRASCIIFLLCFLYNNIQVQKSASLCFDDSKDGIKIIATVRSSHSIGSTSQLLEVSEAPCCSSPWKECTLSKNIQLKFENIKTMLEYPFEPLLFKVRNKCFANGICRDNIWYSLNNFKWPRVSQSVDIIVSVQTSKTETNNLGRIHLNSSYPLSYGHRGALKFYAHLMIPHSLVDLGPSDPVVPIDDKFLLVPGITSTTDIEHRQIKNGSLEYLVVEKNLFNFPNHKNWMKTNPFFSLENPDSKDYLEISSEHLDKQPFDLWLQDRIQQLLGKPTKFFLSSYGTVATNQPNKRNTVSFVMEQDLVAEVTIISSSIQLTRHGILMTFLRTISDPYPLITSVCNTISVSVWTCIESLTSILSSMCKVLTHLITVLSEFLSYYDDKTLKNEFWKAWDALNIIFWSNSYGLHLLIVLRILFVCIIAIITWSLFGPVNHRNNLRIHTADPRPSSDDTELIEGEVLTGVNNELTNEHQHPAGTHLLVSLSGSSIGFDCSEDSQTSHQSSLCGHTLLLKDITLSDEDEVQDDLLDDHHLSRPPFHDYCFTDPFKPLEVMSLSYDSTTLSETAGSYDADDEAEDETDDEPPQRDVNRIALMNIPFAGTQLELSLSGTFMGVNCSEDSQTSPPHLSRPTFPNYCFSESSRPLEVMSLSHDSITLSGTAGHHDADDEADDESDDEPPKREVNRIDPRNIHCELLMILWAYDVSQLKGFFINPYWRMACSSSEARKTSNNFDKSRSYVNKFAYWRRVSSPSEAWKMYKQYEESRNHSNMQVYWRKACSVPGDVQTNQHFEPRLYVRTFAKKPCALARLAKSQINSDPAKIPTFGQWVFSGKINPYWAFQNEWPTYTWSTSRFLPTISGTLMRGLPWKDVIYFPGGFLTPCPAFSYRTEPLVYLS